MPRQLLLFANFGGPRNLREIPAFLQMLLTDEEVIRTSLPKWLQDFFFRRLAKKRSFQVARDYALIGGKSPIYEDTEWMAGAVAKRLSLPFLTFHRYLSATHESFIEEIESTSAKEIVVFPLFPQFSYATTGSIARWFSENLTEDTQEKLRWIRSYATHEKFISSHVGCIQDFLEQNSLQQADTYLLFSAHGLPRAFIQQGDVYQSECEDSFHKIRAHFSFAESLLCYQSQFGKEEWTQPYTSTLCKQLVKDKRKNAVCIPLSFTSDHIETLYEIEHLYLPIIRGSGLNAFRCPALNRREQWLQTIGSIIQEENTCCNQMLIRRKK